VPHRNRTCLVLVGTVLVASGVLAEGLSPVPLPAPQIGGGLPLMQALQRRATSRAFAPDPLPPQTLANLLWAAWGINRPGEGKRTAPSAHNWQEIEVVVVTATGSYTYDAAKNALEPLAAGDLRALAGTQEFVRDAPVTLVYVADTSKMEGGPDMRAFAYADAAFVSQNVYLFCASEGLATGVRASIDRPALAKALGLRDSQMIVLAQSVGFPKKP
jgi:nitroreductase